VRRDGDFVLYWMIAFRRTKWNFALDRAVEWSRELKKPLLIFEPLRVDYRWASDRMHRFVIEGMADNARRIASTKNRGIRYFPYVEPAPNAGKGLLAALAERACAVVTDEYPAFFLPPMVSQAGGRLGVRAERVDSNGLLPLQAADRAFATALSFRRFLQKQLPSRLEDFPCADSLAAVRLPAIGRLPAEIERRWPPAGSPLLSGSPRELAALPIDHSVPVVAEHGGAAAARDKLRQFLAGPLPRYAEAARQPDENVRSGLSPYLHFGHIGAHELFHELMAHEGWSPEGLGATPRGQREGWWAASVAAEAWLDQFVTWRELSYNVAAHSSDYDRYESLPAWSQATLERHARDVRPHLYPLEDLARARTHDPLWNAAQTQLLREGRIHNYLRMLWGKKILEWTATPQDAFEAMVELNNRYALDGRDPNSYAGIAWVLGRFDRPWGPERPIFGTVRYMSSANTAKKLPVKQYLDKYGP